MTDLLLFVESDNLEQLFTLAFLSFVVAMALTPLYTTAAYAGKWWKKQRTHAMTGEVAAVYTKLHAAKHQRHIPTMAGIIFVLSTITLKLV